MTAQNEMEVTILSSKYHQCKQKTTVRHQYTMISREMSTRNLVIYNEENGRLDYETRMQIMKDDRFKPIERIKVVHKKKIKESQLNEDLMEEQLKVLEAFFWHKNLFCKNMSLLQQKEIINRLKGKQVGPSSFKQLKIENQLYQVESLTLPGLKRSGSLNEIKGDVPFEVEGEGDDQDDWDLEEERNYPTDREDMIPRHIIKINQTKYEQLLEIKK